MNRASSAAPVWATPELRGLIIDHMDLDDVRKLICLSRNAFPDMVRVLYRRFHLKNYYRLCKFAVSVSQGDPWDSAGADELIVSITAGKYTLNRFESCSWSGRISSMTPSIKAEPSRPTSAHFPWPPSLPSAPMDLSSSFLTESSTGQAMLRRCQHTSEYA